MIYWPIELPAPLMGTTYNPVDPQMRTTMQSGRTLARRKFTVVPVRFQARWIFKSSAHAALFEDFYRVVTTDGAEWFAMPLLLPQGRDYRSLRFIGPYSGPKRVNPPGANGDFWEYSAVLELSQRPSEIAPQPPPLDIAPPLDITPPTYWENATQRHLVWDGEKWSITIEETTGGGVGLQSTFALQQLLGQDLTTSPLIVEWEARGWGPVDMYIFASSGRFATTYSSGHPQNTIIRTEFEQKNTDTTAFFTISRASENPPEPAGRQVIIHKIYLEVEGME